MTRLSRKGATMEPIAVVGIGCRFPGAPSPSAFWQLLQEGRHATAEVPLDRWDVDAYWDPDVLAPGKMNTRWGGFLERIRDFDPQFFGISPREAAWMDPQQRILLEVAWEAFEDAGVAVSSLAGSDVGVFVGLSTSDFSRTPIDAGLINPYVGTGSAGSIAANRISYLFDFHGPSMAVDTACSSALVAVHLACQSLWNGESTVALAGGVNIILSPEITIAFTKAGMMSADGRCKTFDAAADGYVRSEGAGVVLLKPLAAALAEGDDIYARILGSALNQDGRSNGLTAPNSAAQEAVIRQATVRAGVHPRQIDYVEAHGTGTPIGDPLEAKALAAALGRGRERSILVGSVKTNIGHMEAAAGIGSLIKVCLALKHGLIPPTLHFERPNPLIPMDKLRLKVPTELMPWPRLNGGPAIAGVNAFGFGGANAHVILAEPPPSPPLTQVKEREHSVEPQLIPLSARSDVALRELARSWAASLRSGDDEAALEDVRWSAAVRRSHHEHRVGFIARSVDELAEQLDAFAQGGAAVGTFAGRVAPGGRARLVFVCSGQGPQWPGMGQQLLKREPVFRDTIARCDELFAPYTQFSLLKELAADEATSRLSETSVAQPALFALQLGLAELWRSWGLEPDVVVGHSLGEVAAATIAGALSLEEAIKVIFHRSRLMQSLTGLGRMAVVALAAAEVDRLLDPYRKALSVAAINSPDSTVVAGATEQLEQLTIALDARGIRTTLLPVNYAFHSPQVFPLEGQLAEALRDLKSRRTSVPFFSTVTGGPVDGRDLGPRYWVANLRGPVLFGTAIEGLVADGHETFLELAPDTVLTATVSQILRRHDRDGLALCSMRRGSDERATVLAGAARLYARGWTPSWSRLGPPGQRFVKLPPYPWTRQPLWPSVQGASARSLPSRPSGPAGHRSVSHSLLGVSQPGAAVPSYEVDLNQSSLAFLRQHRIDGAPVLAATAYLEMGLALAADLSLGAVTLRDVRLHRMKDLGDSSSLLQVIGMPLPEGEMLFQIRGATDGGTALYAGGTIRPRREAKGLPPVSVNDIRQRCQEQVDGEQLYADLARRGLGYDGCFRGVGRVWRRDGEALAEVRPETGIGLDGFQLHPAILDACLHVVMCTVPAKVLAATPDTMMVPVQLDALTIYRPLPHVILSHVRVSDESRLGNRLSCDVRLLDGDGAVIAELRGLQLQDVPRRRVAAVTEGEPFYEVQWISLPPVAAREGAFEGDWVLVADKPASQTVGMSLVRAVAAAIEAHGGRCVFATADAPIPTTLAAPPRAVLFFAGVADDPTDLGDCHRLLAFAQAITARRVNKPARLRIITTGCQPPTAVEAPPQERLHMLGQSMVWAFGLSLGREHPELNGGLIDIAGEPEADLAEALAWECVDDSGEDQVVLRSGERLAARLAPLTLAEVAAAPVEVVPEAYRPVMRLVVKRPGSLDGVTLERAHIPPPEPGQIEIEVQAAGLNFRDVMKALGIYPLNPGMLPWLGDECCGVVTACGDGVAEFSPGDEVIAIAPASFSTRVQTWAHLAVRKPAGLSAEEAATIPIAFSTAYHALVNAGCLSEGESVLIHAGAGGVGQAAIQVAHSVGAEVFATAGSEEKREYLRSCGVRAVWDSRNLDFADEILARTDGRGVDVVLNSLAGEAITSGLSVLRPFGRFVEIGKRDIVADSKIGLRPFQRNLSLIAIDMERLLAERPRAAAALLHEIAARFQDGRFRPLPLTRYSIDEVSRPLRFMAQRKNIGKVVLSMNAQAQRGLSGSAAVVRGEDSGGSYLITGGLGGLGLAVAGYLAEHGARRLVLLSRRTPNAEQVATLTDLRRRGVLVETVVGDVADRVAMAEILDKLDARGIAPRGIVHAAGVLDDGLVEDLDPRRLEAVLRPKVLGAWNLHELTSTRRIEEFVLFSSITSVTGSSGQTNYAAANAFLDALSHHRHRLGLPSVSVNWGPWRQVGMAARAGQQARIEALGIRAFSTGDGLDAFARVRNAEGSQVIVVDADWRRMASYFSGGRIPSLLRSLPEAGTTDRKRSRSVPPAAQVLLAASEQERSAKLIQLLKAQFTAVTGVSGDQIDARCALVSYGFDSLAALELLHGIQRNLGVELPLDSLNEETTLDELAATALQLVLEQDHSVVEETELVEATTSEPLGERYEAPSEAFPTSAALSDGRLPELDPSTYTTYVRPEYGAVLDVLGLDVEYTRAVGDHLAGRHGHRRYEVLDLLGGYGSLLFGHNHPDLVATAVAALGTGRPAYAQGSNRTAAGTLGRVLSKRIGAVTGADYVAVFASTGAEVIEAGLKHAALEYANRIQQAKRDDECAFRRSAPPVDSGVTLTAEASVQLRELLGGELPSSWVELCQRIRATNEAVYHTPPLFLAVEGSFHGKTLGALQVTANPGLREPFDVPGKLRVRWLRRNDVQDVHNTVAEESGTTWMLVPNAVGEYEVHERSWVSIACAIVEPIQGEGGIHVLEPAFLCALEAADFPLLLDEIQSGMSRTGTFLASEGSGLRADYYALGKSLGGGLSKIGVLLVDRARYQREFGFLSTSTFAEDDHSALLALKALEILDRDRLAERCRERGEYLLSKLRALQAELPEVIGEVRGRGLMIGVEFHDQARSSSPMIRHLFEQEHFGYVAAAYLLNEERLRVGTTLSSPNTLRLEPSAYIGEPELDRAVAGIRRLAETIACANAARLMRFIVDDGACGDRAQVRDWAADPPPPRRRIDPSLPKVAFFWHFADESYPPDWDPSLTELTFEQQRTLLKKIHPFTRPVVMGEAVVESATGQQVGLELVAFAATSGMIEDLMRTGATTDLVNRIKEAVEEARERGCRLVGLGGFLSIVTQNGRKLADSLIPVTSGNAYTVALGVEGLRRAVRERGIDLSRVRLGAIGAGGNICSTYLRILAEDASQLTLIGRPRTRTRLERVAATIYQDAWERLASGRMGTPRGLSAALASTRAVDRLLRTPTDERPESVGAWLWRELSREKDCDALIQVEDSLEALRACDVIVTASNSPMPLIYPRYLSADLQIICDIAYPTDVAPEVHEQRPDVLVLRGGLAQLPGRSSLELPEARLPRGHLFGCTAETVLLGLEGIERHFSLGQITLEQTKWIAGIARKHGFELGYHVQDGTR